MPNLTHQSLLGFLKVLGGGTSSSLFWHPSQLGNLLIAVTLEGTCALEESRVSTNLRAEESLMVQKQGKNDKIGLTQCFSFRENKAARKGIKQFKVVRKSFSSR